MTNEELIAGLGGSIIGQNIKTRAGKDCTVWEASGPFWTSWEYFKPQIKKLGWCVYKDETTREWVVCYCKGAIGVDVVSEANRIDSKGRQVVQEVTSEILDCIFTFKEKIKSVAMDDFRNKLLEKIEGYQRVDTETSLNQRIRFYKACKVLTKEELYKLIDYFLTQPVLEFNWFFGDAVPEIIDVDDEGDKI